MFIKLCGRSMFGFKLHLGWNAGAPHDSGLARFVMLACLSRPMMTLGGSDLMARPDIKTDGSSRGPLSGVAQS